MNNKAGLTSEEWDDLRVQIQELFDVTLRYAEVVAKESDRVWDSDRPKFTKLKDTDIDDALLKYQNQLNSFEEERKVAYNQMYERLKSDGFSRVVKIERYVEKLAAAIGADFHVTPEKS
ncbi:MAG: hypothetical protein SFU91_09775 [Chloroherpetonaceae bacterium]|nr:hypothetical protein [Chloroherpetonaceae bacterium]